ncbi:MAG: hypothetical protein K2N41_02925 [Lachnospiraceae bacterium]|nr:hypothetical protein [Lachnospiraceae bacterium]MDE7238647.1 hypothetical protein [Lachnospiraceae bacterium]
MALIRCNLGSGGKKENDLYYIWLPYGNSSFTAPRDGKVKVIVFMCGKNLNLNTCTAKASILGATANHSTYVQSTSALNTPDNNFQGMGSSVASVKKGTTYTVSVSTSQTSIYRYGAFITYIG